jgi:uncharacterized protein (TIGR00730 family)
MKIKSLAVFCGSKNGNNPVYVNDATRLGKILGECHITLIYGGGGKGIMKAIADSVMNYGGKVVGIIPKLLLEWEHQHEAISELIVVEDMHTRKKKLYELCDAALILPGGFGTLDELFEMLTWNQLSIHDKKIFILNSAGFYNHLIEHLRQLEADKFLYDRLEERIHILNNPGEFISYVEPSPSAAALK